MKYLVTGGSGYFGSLLRDRLIARGESVRVFDLSDASDRTPAVEFIQGDIRDPAKVMGWPNWRAKNGARVM